MIQDAVIRKRGNDALRWRIRRTKRSVRRSNAIGVTHANVNSGSSIEKYLYDGVNVLGDYNNANVCQASYVTPFLDHNLIISRSGNTYYYLHDGLGSVRTIVDSSSNMQNAYDYAPDGVVKSGAVESISNRYKFTGREHDTQGNMYNYRARMYKPGSGQQGGRFMQRDPIGYGGGLNVYGYCGNNPVNRTDPFGTDWRDDLKKRAGDAANKIADNAGVAADASLRASATVARAAGMTYAVDFLERALNKLGDITYDSSSEIAQDIRNNSDYQNAMNGELSKQHGRKCPSVARMTTRPFPINNNGTAGVPVVFGVTSGELFLAIHGARLFYDGIIIISKGCMRCSWFAIVDVTLKDTYDFHPGSLPPPLGQAGYIAQKTGHLTLFTVVINIGTFLVWGGHGL